MSEGATSFPSSTDAPVQYSTCDGHMEGSAVRSIRQGLELSGVTMSKLSGKLAWDALWGGAALFNEAPSGKYKISKICMSLLLLDVERKQILDDPATLPLRTLGNRRKLKCYLRNSIPARVAYADMCRSQKSGSNIHRIRRQNRMSRSRIYRIPR